MLQVQQQQMFFYNFLQWEIEFVHYSRPISIKYVAWYVCNLLKTMFQMMQMAFDVELCVQFCRPWVGSAVLGDNFVCVWVTVTDNMSWWIPNTFTSLSLEYTVSNLVQK